MATGAGGYLAKIENPENFLSEIFGFFIEIRLTQASAWLFLSNVID